MSLHVSVAVVVNAPDGVSLIQLHQADTAINPNPEDVDAEVLLATATFDRLIAGLTGITHERLSDLRALIANMEKNG